MVTNLKSICGHWLRAAFFEVTIMYGFSFHFSVCFFFLFFISFSRIYELLFWMWDHIIRSPGIMECHCSQTFVFISLCCLSFCFSISHTKWLFFFFCFWSKQEMVALEITRKKRINTSNVLMVVASFFSHSIFWFWYQTLHNNLLSLHRSHWDGVFFVVVFVFMVIYTLRSVSSNIDFLINTTGHFMDYKCIFVFAVHFLLLALS